MKNLKGPVLQKISRATPFDKSGTAQEPPKQIAIEITTQKVTTANDVVQKRGITSIIVTTEKASLSQTAGEYCGLMQSRGDALTHKAAPLLLAYAKTGCPVNCGRNWITTELEAVIEKGPRTFALLPDSAKQLHEEARGKERQGYCRIIKWKDIKKAPPTKLKISPIAMIPHKSRKYWAILNLSYQLLVGGCHLPSINDTTKKMAPPEALDQLGDVIPWLIKAMAKAPDGKLLFAKLNINNGYWQMSIEYSGEWNFAYMLPPTPECDEILLVIPSALQMGWCESPAFFCTATETAQDIAV